MAWDIGEQGFLVRLFPEPATTEVKIGMPAETGDEARVCECVLGSISDDELRGKLMPHTFSPDDIETVAAKGVAADPAYKKMKEGLA